MTQLRDWQREALQQWRAKGRRAVIEAVTGSGKTEVGIAAVAEAVREHRQVLVVVPTTDLLRQWHKRLKAAEIGGSVGCRGDGSHDTWQQCDVLISTVQSSIGSGVQLPRSGALLVADEVHRYGADSFSQVLSEKVFDLRLGLTATLERSDDGIERFLNPFFENQFVGCTYQRGYVDGILAPVNVALVPVPFSPNERVRYEQLRETAKSERHKLINQHGCTAEPFGMFLRDVQVLANDLYGDASTRSARRYMRAFSDSRDLLAKMTGKEAALGTIAHALGRSERSLIFSETKGAAASAAEVLLGQGIAAAPYTSDLSRHDRVALLSTFKVGGITALAAPRILDEGIDVPEADVGIVMAASKTRRQMIQRMGRVIRPKKDGRAAVFIVMFAEGSSEDPDCGAHGTFLEQITEIAQKQVRVEPHQVREYLDIWLPSSGGSHVSEVARDLASATTAQVTERAEAVHKRSSQVRDAVADATRFARPDVLDKVLGALIELDPDSALVLVHRFGLDGSEPLDFVDIAAVMQQDSDEIIRIHDDALAILQLPELTIPARPTVAPKTDPGSSSPGTEAKTHNPIAPRPVTPGNTARTPITLSKKPESRTAAFGTRHISWPKRNERVSKPATGTATPPKYAIRIYLECEGGFMPQAAFDRATQHVTLDYPIRGQRQFDNPDDAARAQLAFYDELPTEPIDGWALWKVQGTGEAIAELQ